MILCILDFADSSEGDVIGPNSSLSYFMHVSLFGLKDVNASGEGKERWKTRRLFGTPDTISRSGAIWRLD